MLTLMIRTIVLGSIFLSSITMAESIEHIQATGEIELCVHPDQPPFSKRSEKPTGFQVDVAQAIAKKLEVSLNVSWIRARRQAKKTECDFYTGVANLGRGDSKYMKLSDPYMRLEFKLVTLKGGKNIRHIGDLQSMAVGVSPGSVASRKLSSSGVELAVRYRDEASRLQALADGLIDAAVVTNVSAGWFQKNSGGIFHIMDAEKVLGVPLNYDYSLGLRKADKNTKEAFNNMLVEMANDGSLANIFKKYGLGLN